MKFNKKTASTKYTQKHAGISLIENIITILLISIALAASIYLLRTMMDSVAINKKKITATYLAQECSELVRNIRDTSWRHNLPWNCGFFGSSNLATENTYFQISNNNIISTTSGALSVTNPTRIKPVCQQKLGVNLTKKTESDLFKADYALKRDSSRANLALDYDYATSETSPFFRRVWIEKANSSDADLSQQLKATCQIGWIESGNNPIIEISQVLTNWRK